MIGDLEPLGRLRLAGPGTAVPDEYVEYGRTNPNPAFRAFIAHALAESGRAEEGVALLGEPAAEGTWDYASFAGDCLRVDVLAAAGAVEPLRTALARIVDWEQEFAMYGSNDCIGSVHYFIGRGFEGLGEVHRARTEYALATEANAKAGIVPWKRRALRRLAALDAR